MGGLHVGKITTRALHAAMVVGSVSHAGGVHGRSPGLGLVGVRLRAGVACVSWSAIL